MKKSGVKSELNC